MIPHAQISTPDQSSRADSLLWSEEGKHDEKPCGEPSGKPSATPNLGIHNAFSAVSGAEKGNSEGKKRVKKDGDKVMQRKACSHA
jgi:hypothetical protein